MSNVLPMFPDQSPAPNQFDELWQIWPVHRRSKKALAKAKYDAITGRGLRTQTLDKDSGTYMPIELSATHDEIMAGAKAYIGMQRNPVRGAPSPWRDEGKFICLLSTWLNQGRWMDLI